MQNPHPSVRSQPPQLTMQRLPELNLFVWNNKKYFTSPLTSQAVVPCSLAQWHLEAEKEDNCPYLKTWYYRIIHCFTLVKMQSMVSQSTKQIKWRATAESRLVFSAKTSSLEGRSCTFCHSEHKPDWTQKSFLFWHCLTLKHMAL